MNVQKVHKNYNLKNELTDEEFVLYKRWCEAINAHEAVAPTTPEPLYMINVSLLFFLLFLIISQFYGTYAEKEYTPKPDAEIQQKLADFIR